VTRLLLLPNGDIMFSREDDSSFFAYRPAAATPQNSFLPVIGTSSLRKCGMMLVAGPGCVPPRRLLPALAVQTIDAEIRPIRTSRITNIRIMVTPPFR
jgi:hypothetical protein